MASPQAAHLLATPDDVEAQFYEALRDADIGKLMAVWSDDDDIVCVHPGGPRVVGAAAIRASFEAIFERGGIPVQPEQLHRTRSLEAAVHNLVETVAIVSAEGLQQAYVVATNVYLKTTLGWRLVAHHASPGSALPPHENAEAPSTLH
ncbi:MAG: nuclear transport factor 2 family protein [Burkholderiaceae bacterium]|nr:MAG: nuclear transport factor 2 family protein [Burkholderiaceae bacterium]MBE7424997.1 nuclear transport factor 2 family protein [Ideonella sp.]MCC7288748.1 nuclear transport factor 2 family protein [Burkholderiaceae bacterium]